MAPQITGLFICMAISLVLNSAKSVKSIRLPNNPNVIIAAITLIPNWQPTFVVNPFTLVSANAGQFYSATIATNASDLKWGRS